MARPRVPEPMLFTQLRIAPADMQLLDAAAKLTGVSRSALLREHAIRAARRILAEAGRLTERSAEIAAARAAEGAPDG